MQTGISSPPTLEDRARRWAQRTWTFGVTGALLAIFSVLIVARSTARGTTQQAGPAARAVSAAPVAVPRSPALGLQYGIIIVTDEAQAARIRVGLADGATVVDPGGALSLVFDVVVVADDGAADRLRDEFAKNNSLLAGTGAEPTVFDARDAGHFPGSG